MVFLDTTPVYHLHVLHPLHVSAYSILHFIPGLNQGNEWDVSGRHCTEWRTEPGGSFMPLDHYARPEVEKSLPRNTWATEERGL